MSIKTYIVFSDVHVPWHDPEKTELAIEAAIDLGVDCVVINGDLADMYNVSSFLKHPDVMQTVDDELEAVYEFLKDLRKRLPDTRIVYLFGNHEDRLEKLVLSALPAFYNRLRLHNELRLDELDIEWYGYNRAFRVEDTDLQIMHSPPSYAETAAASSMRKKIGQSFIYGCTHRPDMAVKIRQDNNDNTVYDQVFVLGGLFSKKMSKEHHRVFSYDKGNSRTGSSIAYITVLDGTTFWAENCLIKDGRVMIGGNIYEV